MQNPIQLFDPASHTYTYLLFDEGTREAVLIDPVDVQFERDMQAIERHNLRLRWTLETHTHADHITSAARLAETTGAHMAAPAGCDIATATRQLAHGDRLAFGGQTLHVLHTPGHTPGSVSYYWERPTRHPELAAGESTPTELGHAMRPDRREDMRHVFTGDALLINGCGRTDFQGGDAGQLYDSVTQVLFTLPETTIVWPAHDYHGHHQSTIGLEKATNERFAGRTREAFIALMNAFDAPAPADMATAVQANRVSGLHQAAGLASAPVRADQPLPAVGYAGDLAPQLAWQWAQNGRAVLVDVRSDAERAWVGFVPDIAAVAWKQWPGMDINADFDRAIVQAAGGQPVMLLCRSGVRSIAAARRATELGLIAYNVLEGFEGDLDAQAQRGHLGGWRHAGLPWRQG